MTGIQKVVAVAGSQVAIAHAVGVTEQAISKWARQGWVPKRRAQELEALYGVSRVELMDPKLRDLVSDAVDL